MKKILSIFTLLIILSLFSHLCYGQSYRDSELQPEKIMDVIGVKTGMVIGEAGAGRGYFTFKLSHRVGETGRICANDIDEDALQSIRSRCEREEISNITTVLGEVDDPKFPEKELDMVFMIAAFHDFEKPIAWLENVKAYLKPRADLVIIEKDPDRGGGSFDHHMTRDEIIETMIKGGFEVAQIDTFLSEDTIYICKPDRKEE